MKKVLVFDFGASSGRAMLCSYDGSKLMSMEIHRFPNNPITVDGTLYWDIDELFKEIEKGIEKAKEFKINAISVDTWGVDFALVKKDGSFIEKPVNYRDSRTDGIPEKVFRKFPEEELYARSGIRHAKYNTIYQLCALRDARPKSLSNEAVFLMMPDLINYYLTGVFTNEYTEASTTGLLDPNTKDWDRALIEKLDLPVKMFGKIVMPGSIIGKLKTDFIGYDVDVIAAPSHDTASAILAVPSEKKDFAYISCGTWTLFGTELPAPCATEEARLAGLTNEGGYNGITFLKNIMGMWLLQECRRFFHTKGESFTYNDMEAFAKTAPHFVARIDPNADEFFKPGNMPEKIVHYCRDSNQAIPKTIAQTLRIIYESLAAEFAATLLEIESITGKRYDAVHVFGGGSKDSLLCQLVSDATDRRVVAGPSEATAIGNAMCSFIALGAIGGTDEAREIVLKNTAITEFLPKNHAEWLEAGKKFSAE